MAFGVDISGKIVIRSKKSMQRWPILVNTLSLDMFFGTDVGCEGIRRICPSSSTKFYDANGAFLRNGKRATLFAGAVGNLSEADNNMALPNLFRK